MINIRLAISIVFLVVSLCMWTGSSWAGEENHSASSGNDLIEEVLGVFGLQAHALSRFESRFEHARRGIGDLVRTFQKAGIEPANPVRHDDVTTGGSSAKVDLIAGDFIYGRLFAARRPVKAGGVRHVLRFISFIAPRQADNKIAKTPQYKTGRDSLTVVAHTTPMARAHGGPGVVSEVTATRFHGRRTDMSGALFPSKDIHNLLARKKLPTPIDIQYMMFPTLCPSHIHGRRTSRQTAHGERIGEIRISYKRPKR